MNHQPPTCQLPGGSDLPAVILISGVCGFHCDLDLLCDRQWEACLPFRPDLDNIWLSLRGEALPLPHWAGTGSCWAGPAAETQPGAPLCAADFRGLIINGHVWPLVVGWNLGTVPRSNYL